MKKEPISISNGTLKGYEDPLRRFAPTDKHTKLSNSSEYEFKHAEEAHKLLKQQESEAEQQEYVKLCLKRHAYRVKMFILTIIFGGIGYYIFGLKIPIPAFLCALFSNYFFFRMFFLGIGETPQKRRRLSASRSILYTVVLGLQIVFQVGYLLAEHYEDEEILGLYLIVALILWVLALILAIFNKIQVNVHNQD